MIEYSLVPLHLIASYVADNIDKHYSEANGRDGYDPLNVDWHYFLSASYAGQCVAVVPYEDGVPVGYSVFFVTKSPCHNDIIEADSIGFYVEKNHRKKVSTGLFRKTTDLLKSVGVNKVNYLLKNDGIGKMLERSGYKQEYKQWSIAV
jgi:hypothetical protein